MLGGLGYRFAVDTNLGVAVGDFTHTFSRRGKMINCKRMKPQNTTVGAVVSLDRFPLGQRRPDAYCNEPQYRALVHADLKGRYSTTELRPKGAQFAGNAEIDFGVSGPGQFCG